MRQKRAEKQQNVPGIVYIIRFHARLGNPAKKHGTALYYVGWCAEDGLERRLEEHRQGHGAAITRALAERKIGFDLVTSFPGTRNDERAVKNYKNTRLYLQNRLGIPTVAA